MNYHPLSRILLKHCKGQQQRCLHLHVLICPQTLGPLSATKLSSSGHPRKKQFLSGGSWRNGATFTVLARYESTRVAAVEEVDNNSQSISQPATSTSIEHISVGDIPEPPEVLPIVEEVSKIVLNSAGEPTFASLGLGGMMPPGWVQTCLEYLHVDVGMPWWAAILTGTIVVRTLVFPLVLKSQRNAAKMSNNMPQMQVLQLKMAEARQTGDALMAAKYGNDLMVFMKEKDISPFKSMLVPLAMAPVFVSFFFGLRKMANLPVESMREGGLFWFTDLTVCDPYYLLPLITSTTLWLTLEIGVDGVKLNSSPHGNIMKYVLRAMPIIVFPMVMNFPAALLCYWVSTNTVSLVQVSLLKIPALRAKCGIEPKIEFKPEALPIKKKGFMESFKDSWSNIKITKEMQDRERYDDISFRRAGRGPVPKTFKYDPTKIQAKSK